MPAGRCGRLGLGCRVSSSLPQREPGLLSYKLFTVSSPTPLCPRCGPSPLCFGPTKVRDDVRDEPAGARAGESGYRQER
jgi:hypothetical protein